MSWYRTGSISLTNGSATVTGTGTAWIANASIGEGLVAPDGRIYEIAGIVSDTSLTISPAYLGATASGQGYAIAPLRGRIAQLLSETSSLLASFAGVRDGIGAGLFPDGTVNLPALRFSADQDTGLRRVGANAAALVAGGADQLRWSSDGLLFIRLSRFLQTDLVGVAAPTLGQLPAGASALFSVDGSYGLLVGTHGNTGNSWLQSQRVDGTALAYHLCLQPSGGNVGIGTAAPQARLDVAAGVNSVTQQWRGAGNNFNLRLQSGDASSGTLAYRLALDFAEGLFTNGFIDFHRGGDGATGFLAFGTSGSERMRIASNGTVRPGADGTQNLADPSFRFNNSYFAVSPTITSDEREKVWRGPMNEAEMRAAKRIIGELGMFQFIDSVEEKGEDARLHFGVRAQRAFAILKEEGLDWWRYAWCCYDKWDETTEPVFEDVTVEKTRIVQKPVTVEKTRTVQKPEEREVEKTKTVMEPVFDEETEEQLFDENEQPIMVEVERTFTVTETVMVEVEETYEETATVEVEETYEETEQRDTGEVRVVREAGDRYGIRADQLAFWLIAAQAEIQSDLDARLAKLEGKRK